MKLKVIGSSSKGNSYILETPTGCLILDCGVRFKEIQKTLDFDLSSVHGCLVTHEHQDHSKGAKDTLKFGIDVFMSTGTAKTINIAHHRLYTIQAGSQFTVGDFTVLAFETEHDATEPLGYLIQYKPTGEKLLFATDTYFIRHRFKGLNYILIECNYCREVLEENVKAGHIPKSLKSRLLESHFSLDNLKTFLEANDLKEVRKIILIHLSDSNSNSKQMIREIQDLTRIDTEIAEPGKVIELVLCPF